MEREDASAHEEPGDGAPRSRNERKLLSLIRRLGPSPKADLARLSGLSPTAVGAIIRGLEADGLVQKGEPQRGRVGQPSIPYSLAPGGAFSLGLKIGRRSAELVLLNALMEVQGVAEIVYPYPAPERILAFAAEQSYRLVGDGGRRGRLVGAGVAAPSEIWCWADEIGAPPGALEIWREIDLRVAFEPVFGAPVTVVNDATAACAAQLAIDPRIRASEPSEADAAPLDFVYFFVGWFIGGGVVIDGRVFEGRRGLAGALGSMLVQPAGGAGEPRQLIRSASIHCLERAYVARGGDSEAFWSRDADWSDIGPPLEAWLDEAADGVAQAIACAGALIDFEAAVIDGSFPQTVRADFVRRVGERFEALDRQGLADLVIREGTIGRNARSIGAACLPLLAMFTLGDGALAAGREAGAA